MFDKIKKFDGLPATITFTDGSKVTGVVDAAGASFFNLDADTVDDTGALRSVPAGYRAAYADVAEIV